MERLANELTINVKRINNTVWGNPRYLITENNNQELFDKLADNKYFKRLKKGWTTSPDHNWVYALLNKDGVEIDGVILKGVCN